MGIDVVLNASEKQKSQNQETLRSVLRPLAAKVRGVELERVRRGRKGVPLLKVIEASLDEDEKPDEFVDELVALILDIAREESEGNRAKFKVVVLGEGAGIRRPQIAECSIVLEEEDRAEATRESELVAALRETKDILKGVGEAYVNLCKVCPNVLSSNADLAKDLGNSLATSQGGRWEWEFKTRELEADKILAGMRVESQVKRSDRMWTSFDGFFAGLQPYLELAAQIYFSDGDIGAPTAAEIDIVFSEADPDFAKLAKAFLAARGPEAENLKIELRKRWQEMPNERKQLVMMGIGKLDQKRVAALGLWMKRAGLQ